MPKPKPGKKSVPWREDPEILRRLATVEDLVLAGYRNTEIADHMKVSEGTIRRDRDRIATLWRDQATSDIVGMRQRSISNLRRLQRLADNEFRRGSEEQERKTERPGYLRVQLDAEKEIIQLEGTRAPVEQSITLNNKTPIESLSTAEILARAAAMEAMAKKLLAIDDGNGAGDAEAEGLQDV